MSDIPEGAIPVDQFQPDAAPSQPPAQMQPESADTPPPGAIPVDQFQSDDDKYGSTGQQALAGVEGFAQGVGGPLATGAEKVLGVPDEDIRGRAAANPWTHGISEGVGLVGGLATGVGEGALAAHLGELGVNAGAHALGLAGEGAGLLGKVTSAAGKAAIENAVIGASDESTKALLNDPTQTAQSAIANVGLAAALGGGIGGALGAVSPLWQATAGTKLGTFIDDMGNRMKFRAENPNINEHFGDTLQSAHDSLDQGSQMLYEKGGLKESEIRRLLPEDGSKAFDTAGELHDSARKTIASMEADKAPQGMINGLSKATDRFETNILKATESKDPYAMYDAINTYKQETGSLSKFQKGAVPNYAEADALGKIRDVNGTLRNNLEDSSIWGKAADVQKDVNGVYSDLQGKKGPLSLIRSKFMTNSDANGWKVDPAKVDTYFNQLGNNKSAVKKGIVTDFVNGHNSFHDVLDKIHGNAGVENPLKRTSVAALTDTAKDLSAGSQAADYMYDKGLSHVAASGLGIGAGEAIGHAVGLPSGISAMIGEHALSPVFRKVLPFVTKPFTTMVTDAAGGKAAIDYTTAAIKQQSTMMKAADSVFKAERMMLPQQLQSNDKDRAKLDARLQSVGDNPQQLQAVGGKIGTYLPEHATAIAATTANAVNYLNSLRPSVTKANPLDAKPVIHPAAQAAYNRALDIAQNPLIALSRVKDGTLQPQDITTLKTVYPALYAQYSSQLMTSMSTAMAKGQAIPYKTRLGMAMFTGQPLDSTMQPQSIMAAQLVSQSSPTNPANAPLKPSQKGASGLSKLADNAQTMGQKREQSRASKAD